MTYNVFGGTLNLAVSICISRCVACQGEIGWRLHGEDTATGREIRRAHDVRNDDILSTSASPYSYSITAFRHLPERRKGPPTTLFL